MTVERASELILCLREINKQDEAVELFNHFVDYFDLLDDRILNFAILCGFPIATNVKIVDPD